MNGRRDRPANAANASARLAAISLIVASLALFTATALSYFVVNLTSKNSDLISEQQAQAERVKEEGAQRRDQSCKLFERLERDQIQSIIRTYAYLDRLPRSEYGSSLTAEIIRGMPEQRRRAIAAAAPTYCNEPDTGLPEDGPTLPPERNFDYLR